MTLRYLSILIVFFIVSCAAIQINDPRRFEYEDLCLHEFTKGDYYNAAPMCSLCNEYKFSAKCLNATGAIKFLKDKHNRQALKYFKKALKIDPLYVQAYNNIGVVYFNKQNYKLSIKYYYKALKIDPGYTDARQGLIEALRAYGKEDQAKEEARKLKVIYGS